MISDSFIAILYIVLKSFKDIKPLGVLLLQPAYVRNVKGDLRAWMHISSHIKKWKSINDAWYKLKPQAVAQGDFLFSACAFKVRAYLRLTDAPTISVAQEKTPTYTVCLPVTRH